MARFLTLLAAGFSLMTIGCSDRTADQAPPPMVVYANGVRYVTDGNGVSRPEPHANAADNSAVSLAEDEPAGPAPDTGPSTRTR